MRLLIDVVLPAHVAVGATLDEVMSPNRRQRVSIAMSLESHAAVLRVVVAMAFESVDDDLESIKMVGEGAVEEGRTKMGIRSSMADHGRRRRSWMPRWLIIGVLGSRMLGMEMLMQRRLRVLLLREGSMGLRLLLLRLMRTLT